MNMHLSRGVTLIELMVVVVIVAILATVAYPSYRQYTIRANRTDAKAGLASMAQDLEKCHTRYNVYDSDECGVKEDTTRATANGLYVISVSSLEPQSFTLIATPQGGQADDTKCGILSIDERGERRERNGEAIVRANKCW